ncbi:polyadenylate-binding protein 1-B-like isoform X4 [Bradysia coprophila]|uniref:polyadenylate-binding protein 1-B-like isoform X4 n=1 Tax=Bradysia coprophila TaxID=38358 RepID=UPI00187D734D|nr:polyadenylate-binding protein 1-B-like isoform X4 [Bradysia coprophila]
MKIQIFIFGLFVVTSPAHDESENETKPTYFHRQNDVTDDTHILKGYTMSSENSTTVRINEHHHHHFTHHIEWHRRHTIPLPNIPARDSTERQHHFTHNPEWHRRHGLPLPNERKHSEAEGDNERHHHFRHNPEWHRRHGLPLPDDETNNEGNDATPDFTNIRTTRRTPIRRTTTRSTTSTPSTTTRRTTAPPITTTKWTSTTEEPEYSREIYDTRRQVEYDDIETFLNRVEP